MTIFKRIIEEKIRENLFKNRAILIFGPRQAGKTTLAKRLLEPFGNEGSYFSCEIASVRKYFEVGKPELLKELVENKKVVVFDEAQTIENIGAILKVFIDAYPGVQIIATGSSSFDLANRINEPLTGRSLEYLLLPLSLEELRIAQGTIVKNDLLELLRLGSYPAVVAEPGTSTKESILSNLATNYLYKDVFIFESIKNPTVFENLVKLLGLQIGSLVSVNELSQTLGVSRATIEKYIRLLEQSYVIKRVYGFSRNPRTEIKKAFKVYFLDVGIRNAVIDNTALIEQRSDKGALLENFVYSELLKKYSGEAFSPQLHFWRTRTGAEIDFVTEHNGIINAYECKWTLESVSFRDFLKKYTDAKTHTVNIESLIQGI